MRWGYIKIHISSFLCTVCAVLRHTVQKMFIGLKHFFVDLARITILTDPLPQQHICIIICCSTPVLNPFAIRLNWLWGKY